MADENRVRIRKARKAHACDICSEMIERGSSYTRVHQPSVGYLYDEKVCDSCIFDYQENAIVVNHTDSDLLPEWESDLALYMHKQKKSAERQKALK